MHPLTNLIDMQFTLDGFFYHLITKHPTTILIALISTDFVRMVIHI